jgi:hypothetical protein
MDRPVKKPEPEPDPEPDPSQMKNGFGIGFGLGLRGRRVEQADCISDETEHADELQPG